MIIYALVIIAILFFLAWNLISNRKLHFIASLITTVLFVVAVGFAVANFGFHYGMHKVSEPVKSQRIYSLSPLKSLKMIAYRPMGSNKNSQLVIYRNRRDHVTHTYPDVKVQNRIVKRANIKQAHVVTKESKWVYQNSWARDWFSVAKKPSVFKVKHVFWVPASWKMLTAKQTVALKQIIKNQSMQLKRHMQSPKVKMEMKQQASAYVRSKVMSAMSKDPKISLSQKKRVMRKAVRSYKAHIQRKAENQVVTEALNTSETIH